MKEKIPAFSFLSREKLSRIFSKIPGKKDLIVDPNIIKPLENVIQISVLRSFDVDKIYKITSSNIPSDSNVRVFMIYADLVLAKYICDHISAEVTKSNASNIRFYLILVPRKMFSVVQLLEEEGVYEYVEVFAFSWEMIPLVDNSVLSLELNHFYKNLFVHEDQSLLPTAGRSLWSSSLLWGNTSMRVAIGQHSHAVCDILDKYFREIGKPDETSSSIDCCIVIDRSVDYITPLLTPTTYTSLLDEVFGIKSGFVELAEGLVISLNNQNIYSQIKNRHFAHVVSFLKEKAKKIQTEYEASQKMSVQEMKHYIKRNLIDLLEEKKTLSQHISACEVIIKKKGDHFEQLRNVEENILKNTQKRESITFLENCIAMNLMDKFSIIRLMCLLSLMQCGVSTEEMNSLKTQVLNAYGYHLLPIFYGLEKLGLLTSQQDTNFPDSKLSLLTSKMAQVPLSSKKTPLQQMIQRLKLIPKKEDQADLKNPSVMNYVFGGLYTPAVCELVRFLHGSGWTKDDILKCFPNAKIELSNSSSMTMNTFFIYFVGGVTYAEISAFQLFEKLTGCQVIIAATNIINGNLICKSCELT